MLQANDFVITESNYLERCFIKSHGNADGYGLVPRNYSANPVGSIPGSTEFHRLGDTLALVAWADMPGLIAEKVAQKSQLSDIRNRADNGRPFKALDQNGQGYCWSYSTTGAAMLLRAAANMPLVRLSGHANAWVIKRGRDQGGWGALSLERAMSHGIPDVDHWKEKSMSSSNNTPETWANAALHKIGEGFIDVDADAYDRNLSFQQVLTCLLNNIPVVADFNFWGHSVCLMDAVDVYPNRSASDPSRYGVRLLNSWTDNWGDNGTGVLTGSKAIPNGAVAPRSILLSDA